MVKRIDFSKCYDTLLGVFAFLMLAFPKLIALGFIAFLVVIIIGMTRKKMEFKLQFFPLLFVTFYLIYALYALGTRHPDIAGVYIENKLSFLLLPILLSFRLKRKTDFNWSVIGYLVGIFVLLVGSYTQAFNCYLFHNGGRGCFLTSLFSYQHHPSYTSVFLVLAMGLLWYAKEQKFKGFKLYWIIPAMIILFITSILCLSLAGILFLFACMATVLLVWIYRKYGSKVGTGALVIAPFLLYFIMISMPQVRGELESATGYTDKYLKDPETFVREPTYPMSGTEVRIVMWTVSTKVFKMYPLGVGTGNVDEVLFDHLNQMGQSELAKKNYNPHNQYLQTGIETGWLGLIILLSIIGLGTYKAFQQRNWLLLLMVVSLAFNNLFESMLQRQSGIVFYTFVLCFLVIYGENSKKIKSHSSHN